jgi:hypothetical protein
MRQMLDNEPTVCFALEAKLTPQMVDLRFFRNFQHNESRSCNSNKNNRNILEFNVLPVFQQALLDFISSYYIV